jgi:hypothetical protein
MIPALKFVRVFFLLALGALPHAHAVTAALFCGGPIYSGGAEIMDTLRASGYTTVIIWTIHVDAKTGDLTLNDTKIASGGAYIGNPGWAAQLATLKQAPTSIDRIELGIGSWGVDDFKAVKELMKAHGSGPDTILYRNFKALKVVTGADAINYDDETCYDADSAVQFGKMMDDIGYKIALCPYKNPGFWQAVQSRLGKKVDAIYLQCYDGGARNTPQGWANTFRGLKPIPGLWSRHDSKDGDTPAQVEAKLKAWKSAKITGAFMWALDDMLHNPQEGTPADYARAIQNGLGETKPDAADPHAAPEPK